MPEQQLRTKIQAPFTFSQSSLQDYIDCARRFQLRYIEQVQWPAIENDPVLDNELRQIEGQQFHRMLQQFMLGLPAEKLARLAVSANLTRWWENFNTAMTGGLVDKDGSNLFSEVALSAPLGNHRVIAKYDLIVVKDGRVIIYDWKTYHKRPSDERMKARPQTRIYQALLVQAGKHLNNGQPFDASQIEMTYWYADFPTKPARFIYDNSHYKQDWEWAGKLVSEISTKQSYPLTEDDAKCGFCPYRSFCDRGVRAGSPDEIETELNVEEFNLEQIQEIEF
jgi:CRISPR/Cas system-associated exonuclease Cas4 (RecB family)